MQFTKIKFLLVLFLLISYCVDAQLIQSTVLDFETKEPILGATVYFDGTTKGTITNEEGVFKIHKTPEITSNLIIRYLGYNKEVIDLTLIYDSGHIIYLKPKAETLEEVVITKDDWSREKKLHYFKREFLGVDLPANQCKIENAEDIKIRFNSVAQELTAYSEKPIIIRNKYLGYIIQYDLSDFTAKLAESLFNSTYYTKEVYYLGTSFFVGEKEKKRHHTARNHVYHGSRLHFMRSIKDNKIEENGFLIFHDKFQVQPKEFVKIFLEQGRTKISLKEAKISILYKREKQSFLITNREDRSFYIDDYGHHFPSENISFGGYLGQKRMSTMLPLNYKLVSENSLQ